MSAFSQLVIALAVFAGGGAAGIKYHVGVVAQRDLKAEQSQAKDAFRKLERSDQAAKGFENDKAKIRTEFLTITKEVDRVVQKAVYLNVCFDDDGLRLINQASSPAAAASQPAPAVPRPANAD